MEGQYFTEPIEREREREKRLLLIRGGGGGGSPRSACLMSDTLILTHSAMSLRNPSAVVRVTGTVSQD